LQTAIVRWKNDRRTILSRQLALLMMGQAEAAGWTKLEKDVVVIPVPTTFRRALRRGFNPAGHLARGLGRHLELCCRPDGLTLSTGVVASKGMGRGLRQKRLQRAFRASSWVEGTDLLLVDDVRTTGGTIHAAAKALRRAGARSVEVALLAAVQGPGS
jgi:ComF family protein